jgi:uncharacterized protein (TIGR03032 family)
VNRASFPKSADALWAKHDAEWRHPAQAVSLWREAANTDRQLLRFEIGGPFWDLLEGLGVTLLVGREYEHLLMSFSCLGRPIIAYHPVPHPSGIAVDRARGHVYVGSTRNPNQVFVLAPITGLVKRSDVVARPPDDRPLIPIRSFFLPGSLYLHDLAFVGSQLHGNAVAHNAIVRFSENGAYRRVWWPRSIDSRGGPRFDVNLLQLNSIAAGGTLADSFFTASIASPHRRRPGHKDFPVRGRGVIFSGRTREPICSGLTRPHSARRQDGRLWVDNSGYGEFGCVSAGRFESVARLPGWTRGLALCGNIAFVGTSRIIPQFRRYAPGLDPASSVCGVHALNLTTGDVMASLIFPLGNQIFALETIDTRQSSGFVFRVDRPRRRAEELSLFYAFNTGNSEEHDYE